MFVSINRFILNAIKDSDSGKYDMVNKELCRRLEDSELVATCKRGNVQKFEKERY